MLKVGLRAQNIPSKEETILLYDHLRKNYGSHTIPEIDLAFELAITGQLDLEQNEVTCYENFSCIYLSTIINAYRKWAANAHKHHSKEEPVQKVFTQIDWREQTQLLLDSFYAGTFKARLTAPEIYDTLILDGYLNALAYEAFWENANLRLRNEIQKDLTAIKTKLEKLGDRAIEQADYFKQQELEKKLIEYRNGSRDAEVKLLSKQMAVYHYFSYLKVKEIKQIYIKE